MVCRNVNKALQRKLYDGLSEKRSLLVIVFGIFLMVASVFQFEPLFSSFVSYANYANTCYIDLSWVPYPKCVDFMVFLSTFECKEVVFDPK